MKKDNPDTEKESHYSNLDQMSTEEILNHRFIRKTRSILTLSTVAAIKTFKLHITVCTDIFIRISVYGHNFTLKLLPVNKAHVCFRMVNFHTLYYCLI